MVAFVTYDPAQHETAWRTFVVESYDDPHYILLSRRYVDWQFLENPANHTGGHTIRLAVDGDQVIAQLGYVPFTGVAPDGTAFRGSWPINLMAHPSYRASGLGALMLRQLIKETDCVLNPGANQTAATLGIGLGMRDLGTLSRYVAIVDSKQAAALALDGKLPAGMHQVSIADGTQSPSRALPHNLNDSLPFPEASFGARRDRAFLTWRYERHPATTYEYLRSDDGRSLLVFHEELEVVSGARAFRVVDFPAQAADQPALLAALLAEAAQRGAAIVDFFASSAQDDILRAAGFHNEADHGDGRIAALFKPLDFRKTGIRVLVSNRIAGSDASWYVTKGDSDQDRPTDCRTIT